jgi:hypothetical protein
VVLLDEDSDAAEWHRFPLEGADAFERARRVKAVVPARFSGYWDEVLAVGIEEPRGYNSGALYRVQGAILACLPRTLLVQPWIPSEWRKAVGLPGGASKADVASFALEHAHAVGLPWTVREQGQDCMDAYCIALATRSVLHARTEGKPEEFRERIARHEALPGDVLEITYVSPQFGHETIRRTVISVGDEIVLRDDTEGREYPWHGRSDLSVDRITPAAARTEGKP